MSDSGVSLLARRGRLIRYWLAGRAGIFVFVAGLALVVALVAVLDPFNRKPRKALTGGVVVGLGLHETRTGSYPVAVVQLPDRKITVELQRGQPCGIGDSISRQLSGVVCHATKAVNP